MEEEIQRKIEETKFKESAISVGEGEDNISYMPDNFEERRDYE